MNKNVEYSKLLSLKNWLEEGIIYYEHRKYKNLELDKALDQNILAYRRVITKINSLLSD